MSLISKAISHLFGGVSQQAASLRDPSQCELMENCWPDVAEGLGKRPPLVHVAKLNTTVTTNRKVHLIDRDGGEQYVVALKSGEVKVYDRLTGTEKTVTTPDGVTYLTAANPDKDFSLFTVADTTFLVNKTKVVTQGAAVADGSTRAWFNVKLLSLPTQSALCAGVGYFQITTRGSTYKSYVDDRATLIAHAEYLAGAVAANHPELTVDVDGETISIIGDPGLDYLVTATSYDESDNGVSCTGAVLNAARVAVTSGSDSAANVYFVSILAGVARQTYVINLPGLIAQFTVDADGTNARTMGIAAGLQGIINGGSSAYWGYTLANTDYICHRAGSTLKIARKDGTAFAAKAFVNDTYGDQAMIGFIDSLETQSQLPARFWTGYTIKVRGAINAGSDDYYVTFDGDIWKETVKPGLQNTLTKLTMPHKLVRQTDGTFVFSAIDWTPREIGDTDSNPAPSFVGRTINNVFFFRERLGFLSGENIIMSRVADYYNFWSATASGQLDDDPIDVAAADARVSFLYHALPFNDTLLLFSDAAQFQLSGGDILSASTVRLDPTTRFSASKVLPPAAAGRNVFFAVNKGAYSSMREYFVTPDGTYTDALDITAHVSTYVPKNLSVLEASSLTDSVFAVSSSTGNELLCYKFMWEGDKKVQSSWGKWILDAGATVLAAKFTETVLALVVVRSDGTYVETIDLQTGGVDTSMDRLVYLDRRVLLTGVYSAVTGLTTWTLPFPDSGSFEVVLGGGYGSLAGTKLDSTKISTTQLTAIGDYSGFPCYVGKPYTQKYRFSEQFIKDKENVAFQTSRLQLRTMTVAFSKTGYFRMEVTPEQRETFSYPYTSRLLGATSATIGTNPVVTGKHRFPIVSNTKGLTIDLINDSPSPSFFQGAEWEGLLTYRAKRV